MASEVPINWRVPADEYEKFLRFVEAERGDRDRYAWVLIENAMREYLDEDADRELEIMIDAAIQAAGRTLGDRTKEENRSVDDVIETLREEETTMVGRRVDADLRDRFKQYVKEHTDFSRYGLALGYALREYRENRRIRRLIEKYDRVADDVTALMNEMNDDTPSSMTPQEKRVIAMCREINRLPLTVGEQPIGRSDIEASIEEVMGRRTEYLIETYVPLILDRLGYEPLSGNPDLFVPAAKQEQDRREEAEQEADELLDQLMAAEPMTDSGRPIG